MGKWIYQAMYRAYLLFFKTEGLLAMGGWPDAAKGETQMYWHERFMVQVPVELLDHVMPFIKGLRAALKELGEDAKASMRSVLAAMEYLALVVVQDALELVQEYPDNPVHKHLMEHAAFRYGQRLPPCMLQAAMRLVHAAWSGKRSQSSDAGGTSTCTCAGHHHVNRPTQENAALVRGGQCDK
jgi:hypothetical protein